MIRRGGRVTPNELRAELNRCENRAVVLRFIQGCPAFGIAALIRWVMEWDE